MVRYVHHELMAAVALLVAIAVGVAMAVGVQDSELRAEAVGEMAVIGLAYIVLAALMRSSRLKWVGEVREFEAAVPVTGADPVSRSRTLRKALRFSLFLVPSVVLGLLEVSWALVIALVIALDWLTKAAVGARWERRNRRQLWRGENPDDPWRLSYTTLTGPAPTRTATDAPPA